MILSSLLFCAFAHAGKLAEGWRGLPYGANPAVLRGPPQVEGCLPGEGDARWICEETINGMRFPVAYMVREELFVGVFVRCATYLECRVLFDTLSAAWGELDVAAAGARRVLADGYWFEGRVGAMWSYNPYTSTGTVATSDLDVTARAEAVARARAKAAAEAL